MTAPQVVPAEFWENRYASTERVWSGAPNVTLAQVVSTLPPGRVLDLGSGEGADVLWLAQQGWEAAGLDISPTAVARAAAAASAAGLSERARFASIDLSTWTSDEDYDLVAASFFQSPVALARAEILRRAAGLVVPGGHLLIVSHAGFPPGAHFPQGAEHQFLTPEEEIAALSLPPERWTTVIAETRRRPTTGPAAGVHTHLDDAVVLLRRT
jgi:SAM-dependent methyltransferase